MDTAHLNLHMNLRWMETSLQLQCSILTLCEFLQAPIALVFIFQTGSIGSTEQMAVTSPLKELVSAFGFDYHEVCKHLSFKTLVLSNSLPFV